MKTVIRFFSIYLIIAIADILFWHNITNFIQAMYFILRIAVIGSIIKLTMFAMSGHTLKRDVADGEMIDKCIGWVTSAIIVSILIIASYHDVNSGSSNDDQTPICNGRGCD